VQTAKSSGDDFALALVQATLGFALMHGDRSARERGLQLLARMRELSLQRRFTMTQVPVFAMYAAYERARCGEHDGAVRALQAAVGDLFDAGELLWCIPGTSVLVETLLDRGADGDVWEAERAINRLAAVPADDGFVARDITLLRLRALVTRARGDEATYRGMLERYRTLATTLGFEGHIAMADEMTTRGG
jgi:hypothetical protein